MYLVVLPGYFLMQKSLEPEPKTHRLYDTPSSAFTAIIVIGVISIVLYSFFYIINEASFISKSQGEIKAKLSWYWPPLLGPNCSIARDGRCVSRMASGQRWENWIDRAVACPEEFPFGTIFVIDGKQWVCMDRGGAIVRIDKDTIWLDMLTRKPIYRYGSEVNAIVIPK